jgi:hypothetical protein
MKNYLEDELFMEINKVVLVDGIKFGYNVEKFSD